MPTIILSGNLIINSDNTRIYLLYRKDHRHYETPGGKVRPEECQNYSRPTRQELEKAAERELFEELSGIKRIISRRYFRAVKFNVPDGREAIAHKFIVRIIGEPRPNEDNFDLKKSRWLPIKTLEKYHLSPDLKMLLPAIKEYVGIKEYFQNLQR